MGFGTINHCPEVSVINQSWTIRKLSESFSSSVIPQLGNMCCALELIFGASATCSALLAWSTLNTSATQLIICFILAQSQAALYTRLLAYYFLLLNLQCTLAIFYGSCGGGTLCVFLFALPLSSAFLFLMRNFSCRLNLTLYISGSQTVRRFNFSRASRDNLFLCQ